MLEFHCLIGGNISVTHWMLPSKGRKYIFIQYLAPLTLRGTNVPLTFSTGCTDYSIPCRDCGILHPQLSHIVPKNWKLSCNLVTFWWLISEFLSTMERPDKITLLGQLLYYTCDICLQQHDYVNDSIALITGIWNADRETTNDSLGNVWISAFYLEHSWRV